MKKKYIFSMVAGLSVMAISSCSEKTASVEEAAKEAVTSAVEKTEEVASAAAESPSAYYVMFKGDGGWGVGKRASSALKKVDGVKSVVLSGLRATVNMNDGVVLSDESVNDALTKKGLSFVSKAAVSADAPKVVYVLNVGGVGWSDTEEKARVALGKVDNVTNVYVGKKTEIWMSEGGSLDEGAVTTMLDGFGLSVGAMEKTDKSVY